MIKALRSEGDHEAALARINALMDAEPGTPEGAELDVLTDLVEYYEAKHAPMGYPSAVAAIGFRLKQAGLTQRDLVPFIGSRAKVSEVLSGRRQITMPMARALHEHLGISAEVLLQEPGASLADPLAGIEWRRFPVRAMAHLGWIPKVRNLEAQAQTLVQGLIARAGGPAVATAALYRKNDKARVNAKMDSYALKAWCWKVLADANQARPANAYRPGAITPDFLGQVARLSWSDAGPRLAQEFLANHGIVLVVARHLPRTHLDGAALKLGDGTPVVGLTIRYDRIDSFWFCLLHELAHLGRHMDNDGDLAFVDDMTLREVDGERRDPKESQADQWAEEALVPPAMWETSEARQHPTSMAVLNLAKVLQIHPAIVAGKVRYERKNYRLLSHFVGTGEVRRHFGIAA